MSVAIVDVLRDFQFAYGSRISLQLQLYQALKERVLNGRLTPGTRLPSSRVLAETLCVSRNTVTSAFDQLKAEGYIKTKKGSGHFISEDLPDSFLKAGCLADEDKLESHSSLNDLSVSDFARALSTAPKVSLASNGSFEAGVPDLKAFPLKVWKQLYTNNLRVPLMGYDSPQGFGPLREVLADYLCSSRGLVCEADQVVVTVGAQQASSIAFQVLLNAGDLAYVEDPGYIGMRKALQAKGARVEGIPVGADGVDLEKIPNDGKGKLICLTPTHQYPMGGIMPLSSRLEVLNWAAKNGVWVLEDDYDSEYHYEHRPIAAMQGLGLEEQVIYVGSFSKVLYPGLRLGYMVVPKKLVDYCVSAKNYMAGQSAIVEQATAADFIRSGHFIRHLRQMRVIYQDKLVSILSACEEYLGGVMTPVYSGAGMHIVLTFDACLSEQGVKDVALVNCMRQLRIYGSALSTYYVGQRKRQGLVLGFANTDVERMAERILTVRKALDQLLIGIKKGETI